MGGNFDSFFKEEYWLIVTDNNIEIFGTTEDVIKKSSKNMVY
jgi:hypothetical protein